MHRRTTSRTGVALACAAAAWVATAPGSAAACAVCFSGRSEETRVAFGISTLFLTLLPLVLIGAAAWWVRRRARLLAVGAAPLARIEPNRARS